MNRPPLAYLGRLAQRALGTADSVQAGMIRTGQISAIDLTLFRPTGFRDPANADKTGQTPESFEIQRIWRILVADSIPEFEHGSLKWRAYTLIGWRRLYDDRPPPKASERSGERRRLRGIVWARLQR